MLTNAYENCRKSNCYFYSHEPMLQELFISNMTKTKLKAKKRERNIPQTLYYYNKIIYLWIITVNSNPILDTTFSWWRLEGNGQVIQQEPHSMIKLSKSLYLFRDFLLGKRKPIFLPPCIHHKASKRFNLLSPQSHSFEMTSKLAH